MKRIVIICLAAISVSLLWTTANPGRSPVMNRSLLEFFDHIDTGEISRDDLQAELYYTMVDEDGREIMVTGRKIHVGDEYITSGNKLYRVFRVRERIATARYIREVGAVFEEAPSGLLVILQERFNNKSLSVQKKEKDKPKEKQEKDKPKKKQKKKEEEGLEPKEEPKQLIGVYHTHNAESYVPTDGTDSINGQGGIHSVGDSFAQALENKGISVIHNQTLHLPHDRGAYRRSRVTVEKLLEKGPDVIFDVHRDAAPMGVYATEIEDEWVTQVQLVVGRQNPTMSVTRQFALDMKKTADKVHPNLVKGIFMARGNYNQDLTAMNLLLEVGAHQNTREAAEDGAALFADVVSLYFYGTEGKVDEEGEQASPAQPRTDQDPGARAQPANRAVTRNILALLGVTLAIAVGFLVLNSGSMDDIRSKLLPYMEKTRPYTEKGDRFLDGIQEKIHAAGIVAWDRTSVFLDEGDRYLLIWQQKIRAFALTVKEKAEELRGDRRKLR